MNDSTEDSEALLYTACVDEAELYARALQLASAVAEAVRRGEGIDDRLQQVFLLLGEVAARDALLAPVKRRWEQAGRPTSDALREAMNRIGELIRQLSQELQVVEQAARARRDQLAVELDDCNRRRQMQRAYQGKT